MKHLRLLFVSLVLVALLTGTVTTPSLAYPDSTTTIVKVPVKPNRSLPNADTYDCTKATLYNRNGSYAATFTNPPASNGCTFIFNNVPVNQWYTVEFLVKYKLGSPPYIVIRTSQSVFIAKPTLTTITTATLLYRPK